MPMKAASLDGHLFVVITLMFQTKAVVNYWCSDTWRASSTIVALLCLLQLDSEVRHQPGHLGVVTTGYVVESQYWWCPGSAACSVQKATRQDVTRLGILGWQPRGPGWPQELKADSGRDRRRRGGSMEVDKETDEGMMLVQEWGSGDGENEGVKAGGRRNFGFIGGVRERRLVTALESHIHKCVNPSTGVCRCAQTWRLQVTEGQTFPTYRHHSCEEGCQNILDRIRTLFWPLCYLIPSFPQKTPSIIPTLLPLLP